MNLKRIPVVTVILVLSTLSISLLVNFDIAGSLLGRIKITQLEPYGAYAIDHILNMELWRLLASQFIHVKQFHMFYNALSLLFLGILIEKKVGSFKFLMVWFITGSLGTLASTFTVEPPWNLGTGGSQAILGVAAMGLVLYLFSELRTKALAFALALTIIPAFMLDILFSDNHLPKLGHTLSFFLGVLFTSLFIRIDFQRESLRNKQA